MSEHSGFLWLLLALWFSVSVLMSGWIPMEFINTGGKRNFLVSYFLQLLDFLLFCVSLVSWPISIPLGRYLAKKKNCGF